MIKYVYIAGPLTKGDRMAHVANALEAGARLRDAGLGLIPMVPHLSHFWDLAYPAPYETWMTQDFAWIEKCDALLRLPGESKGADREVALASERGLLVFTDIEELIQAATEIKKFEDHPTI